jgi:hypothetical protein
VLQSFRLDSRGVREVLKGDEVRQMVDDVALNIQVRVRARVPTGTTVKVEKYTTDRGAAAVVIADRQAMAWQARDGVLTRAAGELGIEVKAWQQ